MADTCRPKTLGEVLRDDAIDRGAAALRAHQMKGRMTVEWSRLPVSQKKKWLIAARVVLDAAEPWRATHDR